MKTHHQHSIKRTFQAKGFTLLELLVAMVITSMLVLIIMQLTNKGLEIWKTVTDEVNTTSRSRVALRTLANDIESMQMRLGDNQYQWFLAKGDSEVSQALNGMKIPHSTQCVFFTSAFDRNPAVGSSESLRSNYRTARAHNTDTQGDINAVGYRLLFRDQILNIPGTSARKSQGTYPLFSLYRQLISPRDAYDKMIGEKDLEAAYGAFKAKDKENFLCENIIEFNLILTVAYAPEKASTSSTQVSYETITVPVISTKSSRSDVEIFGDYALVKGKKLQNGHISTANISVTVVTEEGMSVINQIRLGQRPAPKLEEFFQKYTRTYARRVTPPAGF